MKSFLFLTAIALAVISCQDEESNLQVNTTSSLPKVQVVQITNQGEIIPIGDGKTRSSIEGETALQFASEADYQSALTEIGKLETKTKFAYIDSNNFVSLQDIAAKADEDLDEIGNTATNEADFRKKYAQYVEKYSEKLITNKYDSEDLTLYVPDSDNPSTYLINENQKVVIGNEVKSISLNNDMSVSDKAVFTPRATAPNVYGFDNNINGKKTNCTVTLEASSGIFVHVGCQKKMWYGYKRDDARDVIFQLNASPMYYTLPNAGGAPYQLSYVQYHSFRNDGNITFATGGAKSSILQGVFYVWTDMTVNVDDLVEYKNVFAKYESEHGSFGTYKLPRLDISKAYGGSFSIVKSF